jgi:hypothetical protein
MQSKKRLGFSLLIGGGMLLAIGLFVSYFVLFSVYEKAGTRCISAKQHTSDCSVDSEQKIATFIRPVITAGFVSLLVGGVVLATSNNKTAKKT